MYKGEIALNEDQLPSLLEAAESLKIKGIENCLISFF